MEHLHSNFKRYFAVLCIFVLIDLFGASIGYTQSTKNLKSVLFLIDVSGSMNGVKMDSVKSAAKQIITMLQPCNTEFAIMAFAGKKESPVPFRIDFTTNQADLFAFIDKLKPWGGTPLGAALKTSSLYFSNHIKTRKSIKQSIILLSDGRSDDNISQTLKELKDKNALIQTECIGYELAQDMVAVQDLKNIALKTGGEYFSATSVSNVIKAFLKSSIKTLIHEVPVEVRNSNPKLNFTINDGDINKTLTTQSWFLDSIQINVSDDNYEIARLLTNENMQDTMPKSIVFEGSNKVSLFIDIGTGTNDFKKWIEGDFAISQNALTVTILDYYFRFIVKSIDNNKLVLCVNKFQVMSESKTHANEEVCDCSNTITDDNPYILVYFSRVGCDF